MTSKKRQKRQLQRRRRIGRNVDTTTINDEPQCVGEKLNGNNPKTSDDTELARNKTKSDGRKNIIVVHSLVDSLWLWSSTWVRKIGSSTVLSTDFSFLPVIPAATSATTIALVLLVSLMVGNHDYILQTIVINPASISICIGICAGLSVSVVLPLLLWWIVCNTARLGDAMVWKDGNEKSQSNDIPKELKIIDDKIATIRPLGLNRPLTADATDDETKDGFDSDEARSTPPTPQLATSEHVRTKLAEWLPFGLRYTSDLNLVFSTSVHGRSLQTLYQRLGTTSSNHTIMLLEAFLPTPSGTGSSPHSRSIVGMYTSQR
jgi:hypothetical protein